MPLFKKASSLGGTITGALDGANLTFALPEPYTSGTLAVFKNGVEVQDEIASFDPVAGTFAFDALCPPKAGDDLQAHYFDTTADGTIDGILETPIIGRLGLSRIRGRLGVAGLTGRLRENRTQGRLGVANLTGRLRHVAIKGELGC